MDTSQTTCHHIRQLLQETIDYGNLALPATATVDHIATCTECRGALTLLAAAITGTSPGPAPIGCSACQEQLAAYIERESEVGTKPAAQEYPQVWWHLWLCPSCVETYQLICALSAATQAGELALPPFEPQAAGPISRLLRRFQLNRRFLNYALPISTPALRALRGGGEGSTLLVADEEAGRDIRMSVQRQPDDDWRVSVTVLAPVAGWLVLLLGEQSFRARFDDLGEAIVGNVPDALLGASNGPDVVFEIEIDMDTRPEGH